jgi:nicotinamidase-related amidase
MSQRTIEIHPRYARLYTPPGIELAETAYKRVALDWRVSVDQCAVVAVDCWNWHFSADTLARIEQICAERIAPLFDACRRAGLALVHCPADPVASRHPNLRRFRRDGETAQAPFPQSPQWPPPEFRAKTGEFAGFARPHEPQDADRNRHREQTRDFHAMCAPQGDEAVVLDGEDLHRLCAECGYLHLFFVGFNTNACVMMRDYGLPAMSRRGYHTILLRDCTTGMEIADTTDSLVCTQGTIATIEQFLGYTMDSSDLIAALARL